MNKKPETENKLVEMLRKAREAKESAPRVETVLECGRRVLARQKKESSK